MPKMKKDSLFRSVFNPKINKGSLFWMFVNPNMEMGALIRRWKRVRWSENSPICVTRQYIRSHVSFNFRFKEFYFIFRLINPFQFWIEKPREYCTPFSLSDKRNFEITDLQYIMHQIFGLMNRSFLELTNSLVEEFAYSEKRTFWMTRVPYKHQYSALWTVQQ